MEEITQLPDGSSNYKYRGQFSGAALKADGLPVNLDLGKEKCTMFFVQEKRGEQPQVLYADSAVTRYGAQIAGRETRRASRRQTQLRGKGHHLQSRER